MYALCIMTYDTRKGGIFGTLTHNGNFNTVDNHSRKPDVRTYRPLPLDGGILPAINPEAVKQRRIDEKLRRKRRPMMTQEEMTLSCVVSQTGKLFVVFALVCFIIHLIK